MGYSHGTYAGFGVHIPREQYQAGGNQTREVDWLNGVVNAVPELKGKGLYVLSAGDYDRDELFVMVREPADETAYEVPLGTFRRMNPVTPLAWTLLIFRLLKEAGYPQDVVWSPSWLVIPDCS